MSGMTLTFCSRGSRDSPSVLLFVVILIFAFFLVPGPGPVSAQEQRREQQQVPVPLRIVLPSGSRSVVTNAIIDSDLTLQSVESAQFLADSEIPWESSTGIKLEEAASDGRLTIAELEHIGFTVHFDPTELSVEIIVPTEALGTQELYVYQRRTLPDYPDAPIATFSAGFPFWLRLNQLHSRNSDPLSTVTFATEPAVSYRSWILESAPSVKRTIRGDGTETETETEFELENTRLVRTWDERKLRLQAGQVLQFSRGLQLSEPLLGVSVDNLQADTERVLVPLLFDRPLDVTSQGTIDVFINGRRSRSFRVEPGRYMIRDVPLAAGINSIRVEYTDAAGNVESYDLISPHTSGLLDKGSFQYALSAGVEEETPDRPGAAGFLRYGISDRITAGTMIDVSTRGTQGGLDVNTALPFAEVSGGAFISADEEGHLGWAGSTSLRFQLLGRQDLPVLSTGVEYRDPGFIRPNPSGRSIGQSWQVTTGLSQALPGRIGLVAGHVYRAYHEEADSSSFLYGGLVRTLSPRFTLKVSGFVDFERPQDQWGLAITVSARSITRNLTGNVAYNVKNATLDASGAGGYDGAVTVNGSLGVQDIGLDTGRLGGVNGSVRAAHHRFDLSANGIVTMDQAGTLSDQQYSTVRYAVDAGAGLYYADGAFAVARPLTSAFALVRPDPDLPVDAVYIDRHGRSYGRSGLLGAAVLGPLQPGIPETVSLSVPGVPADFALTPTDYIVTPRYRTGTAITVGTLRELYVRGRLLDADGKEVPYVGLTVTSDETGEPQSSFTDEAGTFDVYQLKPGRYRAVLADGSGRFFVIDVPDVPGPLVELGTVHLDTQKDEP